MKRISVVTSAFNEEKDLPKCLESLTNQTLSKEKYELNIVDNNSTDKTPDIAKTFGANVIKETKQGYVFALSTGMNQVTGEIIAVTDADTIVPPNWLEVIDKAFEDEKVVAVTGIADVETKSKLFYIFAKKFYDYFLGINFLIGKPHLTGFNFAVRRSVFNEIGGLDTNYTMSPDVDLGLRMSKKGKVIYLKEMTVTTSFRRWQEEPLDAFTTYLKGYLWSAWLRKPPPVKQTVVR